MKKKLKIKKFNLIMAIILTILVVLLGFCIVDLIGSLKQDGAKEVEVLEKIEKYDYSLNENDSPYFKKQFTKLKETLEGKEIDEEKYAKLVSKLFVIDFYSLEYALSKNDVGGVQFVYQDYQDTFVKKAKDTVYKYVESNIYGNRDQELPTVSKVEITSIKQEEAKFENDVVDEKAYYVEAQITYKDNLEYAANVELILIHNDKKLEIAKMS